MNATEVIEDARRWADLHRANAYQREGVKRVDDLLTLAEEQAATIARVRALADQAAYVYAGDLYAALDGEGASERPDRERDQAEGRATTKPSPPPTPPRKESA